MPPSLYIYIQITYNNVYTAGGEGAEEPDDRQPDSSGGGADPAGGRPIRRA